MVGKFALFFIANISIKTRVTGQFFSRIDVAALLLALCAGVALLRYKVGVMPVLGACALAGLALRCGTQLMLGF